MGAWMFLEGFLEGVAQETGFEQPRPRYAGRRAAASPATGIAAWHKREQAELLDDALTVGRPHLSRIQVRKLEAEGKRSTNLNDILDKREGATAQAGAAARKSA